MSKFTIISSVCHLSFNDFYAKSMLIFGFLFFTVYCSSAQQLESLIEEALTNNPEIQSFELKYRVAKEKVNEAHTLPNTEVAVGYFISEPETRTGAQRFRVSAKQMLPWFGHITARENYTSALAEAQYEDIIIAKRKLIASVSQSYYKLYANMAKQEVLAETIALLKTYENLALTAVAVGKASAVDILRLQIRQNELEQSKQVLAQHYLAEQTNFNKRLHRDKDIEVNVVNALTIPADDFEIYTEKLTLHPELLKYDKLYSSVEQSELLNQKKSNPMIGFGLEYINVERRPNIDFSDNGKDVLMPTISLSIPIFNTTYKSQTKQNDLQRQELLTQKQERLNVLETILDKAIKERTAARISHTTQVKNLKRAEDAAEILIKSYETGTIDFNDLLDIQELQLKFQIRQIEAVKNYYVQTVIINYLTN